MVGLVVKAWDLRVVLLQSSQVQNLPGAINPDRGSPFGISPAFDRAPWWMVGLVRQRLIEVNIN